MIGTISIKLKNIAVSAYFPAPMTLEESLIVDGSGSLSISFFPPPPGPFPPIPTPGSPPAPASTSPEIPTAPIVWRGLRYYLQVTAGKRTSPLRLGQVVKVTASDEEGKPIQILTPLETLGVGDVALFGGPMGFMAPAPTA